MEIIEDGLDDFINSVGSKRDRGVNNLIKYLTTTETCSHTMREKHSTDKWLIIDLDVFLQPVIKMIEYNSSGS